MIYVKNNKRYTVNQLRKMGVVEPLKVGFSILQNVEPTYNRFTEKLVDTNGTVDNAIVYEIVPLSLEEKVAVMTQHAKDIVSEVDRFMDKAIVTIKGYDSRDSIGKFLVQGNPFYGECSKIAIWVANCYATCFTIQAAITTGKREIPTVQEVVDSLPTPDFLTEDELDVLTAPAVDMMNGGMM